MVNRTLWDNDKLRVLAQGIGLTIGICIFIKYVVPLIWPLLLGGVVSLCISPVVNFLVRTIKMKRSIATILTLILFFSLLVLAGAWIGRMLIGQGTRLVENWDALTGNIDGSIHGLCGKLEDCIHMRKNEIYLLISDGFSKGVGDLKEVIMTLLMNHSFPAFIKSLEIIAAIIIVVLSAFYLTNEVDKNRKWARGSLFSREISLLSGRLSYVFKAYFKAQGILMVISVIVCFVGFSLMKNPYSLLLALIIGALDALPMIGMGIITIPWAIVLLLWGDTKNGIVLLVVFMVCYIIREIMEPRLMGDGIGMSPIMSLGTIYAGYKLLGLLGILAGPVAYILIKESMTNETHTGK